MTLNLNFPTVSNPNQNVVLATNTNKRGVTKSRTAERPSDAPATTRLFRSLSKPFQNPVPLRWCTPGNPVPSLKLPPRVPEGDLLLNGPGAFTQYDVPIGHWFDGPGFVQRYSLARDASTHGYQRIDAPENWLERLTKRSLKGGLSIGPAAGIIGNIFFGLRNAANTNVIITPGGEIQSRYEACLPTRLATNDLKAIGVQRFGNVLPAGARLSAHPARHADGSLWDFHLDNMAQTLTLYRIGANDTTKCHLQVTIPNNGIIHDIVATENHIVTILSPLVYPSPPTQLPVWVRRSVVKAAAIFNLQPPLQLLKWEPTLGTHIGIFSIGEDKTTRWIKSPKSFFNWHIANAFENKNGSVTVDACIFDNADFMWGVAHDMQRKGFDSDPAKMSRLKIDVDDQITLRESKCTMELPDVSRAIRGVCSGSIWGLSYKDGIPSVPACYDPDTDVLTTAQDLKSGDYASTPVMLDERVVATVVSNIHRSDSKLHLYNAAAPGSIPLIATADLTEQIPPTFHGFFKKA